jgi:hypothetical protein
MANGNKRSTSEFTSVLVQQGGHAVRVRPRLLGVPGVITFHGIGSGASGRSGTALSVRHPHPLPAPPRHDHMPLVLHGVVGAPREEPGDHGPPVAVDAVRGEEQLLLFLREGAPVDPRVELIEPPQPAAFP